MMLGQGVRSLRSLMTLVYSSTTSKPWRSRTATAGDQRWSRTVVIAGIFHRQLCHNRHEQRLVARRIRSLFRHSPGFARRAPVSGFYLEHISMVAHFLGSFDHRWRSAGHPGNPEHGQEPLPPGWPPDLTRAAFLPVAVLALAVPALGFGYKPDPFLPSFSMSPFPLSRPPP